MNRSVIAALAASISLAGAAFAQSPSTAVDATIACLDIADDAERLACLDRAAKELKETRILRGADARSEELERAPVVETEAQFGTDGMERTIEERQSGKLRQIEAKVAEARIYQRKKVILTLDNGQIWRQLQSDSTSIPFSRKGHVYSVRIKRGPLGNYMLFVDNLKRGIRVERIK